jgi:hypothetical protein
MRRSVHILSVLAVIVLAGCLAAGCGSAGSSIKNAVSGAASNLPSRSASAPAPSASAPASGSTAATVAPASAAPASAPAASPSATPASGSGSSLIWLWILLGVVVAAILIAWITRAVRRGSAKADADWRSRRVDAYAKGSALYDAMSVAESPGAMAASDAGFRWADIQRRADDLAQTLYGLREAVPDPADKVRVADTLASLQAVRSAMDAERAPGGAGPRQAEVARVRLDAFESSLRALRTDDQRYP